MSKKTLISVACGIVALSCVAGVSTRKVSASTTYGELLNDNFEASTTFNTENWNEVGADSGATIGVKNDIYLTLALANAGSVATKDSISVGDTECLVIDVDMRSTDINSANLSFVWGSDSQDLTGASAVKGFNFFTDGMMMFNATYTFPKYNADHTQNAMWTVWARDQKITIYVQPDGSAYLYQGGNLLCYAKAEDMSDAMKVRNGYVGVCHSGGAGTVLTTNYIKIGKMPATEFVLTEGKPAASRTVSENTTWIVDDSNPTKAGLSDAFVTNQASDIVGWSLANNYVNVNEKAADLVSKAEIPAADARIDKMFVLDADWDVSGLGSATAKFAFGTAAVGITSHDDKNYLTIWNGGSVAAEAEVVLGKGGVNVIGYGDGSVKATFNGATVSATDVNCAGVFAYNVTEGATNVTLDNVVLQGASAFERMGGVSQATDFTELDESKWYVGSTQAMAGMPQGGGVYVEDGQIVFMNAGDGSMVSTKEAYNNFEFGFDLTYIEQEGQENDDGDITRAPSLFPGISYNMESASTFFGNGGSMIYFQKQTVDLFGNAKFADGTTRVWLTEAQDMYTQNAAGKVVNFKVVAQDGTMTVTISNKTDGVEMYSFQLFNQNTNGHIGVQTTGCGNFELDNMYIVNLDDVVDYELTQKTIEAKTENVFEGATISGAIDLGDMTNKSAVFTVAEVVEGFTMNADGTYTYAAPETAPAAPVVVNYTVDIDDFDLGFVHPVGDASCYSVNGTITINVNAIVISSIEITAPTKLTYKTGETISLDGLAVKAIYNDGHEEAVAEGYEVDSSAVDFSKAGDYTVTVSYAGKTATFSVKVEAKASGCGSTATVGAMASVLALGVAALVVKKGKKED